MDLYVECVTLWVKVLLGYVFFVATLALALGIVFAFVGLIGAVLRN
jgi:hypothetical protein